MIIISIIMIKHPDYGNFALFQNKHAQVSGCHCQEDKRVGVGCVQTQNWLEKNLGRTSPFCKNTENAQNWGDAVQNTQSPPPSFGALVC